MGKGSLQPNYSSSTDTPPTALLSNQVEVQGRGGDGTDITKKKDDNHDEHFEFFSEIEEDFVSVTQWKLPPPWDISVIRPELHFYVEKEKDNPMKIEHDEEPEAVLAELEASGYFQAKGFKGRIVFLTHGFENDIETEWLPRMKDEILKAEPDSMVVLLGWGGGSKINVLRYTQAAANTQSVAKWFTKYLKAFKGLREDLYLYAIGHSLGSHLLGLAGRQSLALNRISALDPAGPSYEKVNEENRLKSTDAKRVDVIHTDGYDTVFDPADWFAPVNHYGTLIPLGTTDFYPNFGFRQPGISHFRIAESHHRSIELFIWSISNPGRFLTNEVLNGYPGFEKPVESTKYVPERVEMGYHFEGSNEGLFYISTSAEVPWVASPGFGLGGGGGYGYWPFSSSSSSNKGWGGCTIS